MGDLIAVVSGAITSAKQLLEIASISKDAKAKLAVAELQIQLAELKVKLADLINENDRLKRELKKAMEQVPEVTVKDGLYFTTSGDGPYCTACYDSQKKLIRVTEMETAFKYFGNWRCGICKTNFK